MPKKKCGKRTTAERPSLNLITLPRCRVTQMGAEFDPQISLKEWADIGQKAIRVSESIQWIIGDWQVFGAKQFIESLPENSKERRDNLQSYNIALDSLPYEPQTLRTMKWVSSKIPVYCRRYNLPHTHHQEVAGMDLEDVKKFLDLAEKKNWSRSQLRVAIRRANSEIPDRQDFTAPIQPFTIWTTRAKMMLSRENVEAWPSERREATKRELQWFVDFYNRL